MQTIFALATARGKSGVAVIRISGPDAFMIGERLVGVLPEAGHFALRQIKTAKGEVLDQGLILTFAAPGSFTGEDTVELQTHGSIAVVQAVELAIEATNLARKAEAGEFTQRALLNDTLDLTQVEGLAKLIDAETEAQRKVAQASFSGELSEKAEVWRSKIIRMAALIEASIDFVEEDVPVDVVPEVKELMAELIKVLSQEVQGSVVAERLHDGFEVAIIGAPNSGKSTLMNALVGRDLAITSDTPGTTRDVIEARVDLKGLPVTFLDTAGLREAEDPVEKIGIERALDRALSADIRVLLETGEEARPSQMADEIDLIYRSKIDIYGGVGVSGLTGEGLDQMQDDVFNLLSDRVATVRSTITVRQRNGISNAVASLMAGQDVLEGTGELEIVAGEVHDALRSLDGVIGRVGVESVLGEIFSNFCIGK